MRGTKHYLRGLMTLHELELGDERRATWRQSMATLAEATLEARGVPLEGMRPEPLLASVRAAMASGLVDDLGFLSPAASACALYGLASALPHGAERRELGRRVLLRLHEGDANTFVSLATAVALGSTRAFEGAAMRARVSLSLVLPIGTSAPVDALALALISRRELAQRWLVEPSTGSLPARRMAARLLERAAREAARRAVQGDDGAAWLFDSPMVSTAWTHLMNDREPLVWRHVATGRGLLSAVVPRFAEDVERDLVSAHSFARGRRGAASLAARVAIRPTEAVMQARDLLYGPALSRDPGIAAAMVYGLPRAAEVEPDAAEALLMLAVEKGGVLAAEALLDLRREWHGTSFGLQAADLARAQLRQRFGTASDDDGHAALIDLLCQDLGEDEPRETSLPEAVFQALTAFADTSARTAYDLARSALSLAEATLVRLEACDETRGPSARRETFRILHELDLALLETSALSDLLALGVPSHEMGKASSPLAPTLLRLESVLMKSERIPYAGGEGVPHLTLRMRRLRTLLHLLDGESLREERQADSQRERLEAVHLLFERVERDAPSAMDRIVHAAIARGCDGLVRDEVFELSDVVLNAAAHVPTPEGFSTLSEGSMLPEVKHCTKALAALVRTLYKVKPDAQGQRALIESLTDLSRALPTDSSPRTEGLRSSLLQIARALRHIASARTLRIMAEERRAIELLEHAVDELAQLAAGARRRLGGVGADAPPTSGHGVWALGLALERAGDEDLRGSLEVSLETLGDSLRAELPPVFASVILRILRPLLERPVDGLTVLPSSVVPDMMEDRPLPAWLPKARVLGGFFVLRVLGSGSGGSVFVVKRNEERNDGAAPELALKVPEYNGSAARLLSEDEFLQLFRKEAGALLALPPHENLASFVTFDAGVRPKPVLVMEFVKGPTLERVLAKGDMDMARAFHVLEGVLSGLACMHSVGVGHLDLKPSNVILREDEQRSWVPVLVDFGLSGRHVRPGCGTSSYGAPEVWESASPDVLLDALPADVYAFGCLVFELLTGQELFDGPTEAATIIEHLGHDGRPARLVALAEDPSTLRLAEWISSCLRRDPAARATVGQLRADLPLLRLELDGRSWPLPVRLD